VGLVSGHGLQSPPTTGRPRGATNKTTRELRALAQEYTQLAIENLVELFTSEKQPGVVRLGAIHELLDRGHGKAAPPPMSRRGGTGTYDFSRFSPDQVRQAYDLMKLASPEGVIGETERGSAY
jgi:hypothetical protein